MQGSVSMVHATIGGELREAGLKTGHIVYLAWDQEARRLFVVQWDRIRWVCSCGRGGCVHKLAANTYAFEESQKRHLMGEDMQAHLEDEQRMKQ